MMGGGALGGPIGVLLMTFGTASSVEDVPRYLATVRGGTPAPEPLVAEFQRRFALVGGSPLIRICREQAVALQARLNAGEAGKGRYRVAIGMRHSNPTIAAGVGELVAAGVRHVLGIVLSPQYSPVVLAGYLRDFAAATAQLPAGVTTGIAGAWHREPEFLECLAGLTRQAIDQLEPNARERAPVIFSAHSLPLTVAERDPDYLAQLQDTAFQVAHRVGLAPERWTFAYQSAGHTREPWLTPDLADVFPDLRAAGHDEVVIAPVQFVADHLEVIYDIDVAARQEAERIGLRLTRTASPNATPSFITALGAVVRREIDAAALDSARASGSNL